MNMRRLLLPITTLLLAVLLSGCVMLPLLFREDTPRANTGAWETNAFQEITPAPAAQTIAPTFPKTHAPQSSHTPAAASWQPPDDGIGGESWAIYIYLCGSDLETDSAAASGDIEEMLGVSLPENVKVVIQAGGARRWHNRYVRGSGVSRLVYDQSGMRVEEELSRLNMGAKDTLADFFRYCRDEHPADRTGYIIWNHGAGSVWGVAFDENYDDDAIQLGELRAALAEVYTADTAEPPISFFGFDACLMATIDTAAELSGYARYMVASQANAPICGWDYAAMLSALADDPGMSSGDFCRLICDSYYADCVREGDREVTLSVVDLGSVDALADSIERMAFEGYSLAQDDPYVFFAGLGREVRRSLLFGEFGVNLYDLGDVLKNARELFPQTAGEAMALLERCVVYQIVGAYKDRASGLTLYYPADAHEEEFAQYRVLSPLRALAYLYELPVTGGLSREGSAYMDGASHGGFTAPPAATQSPSIEPQLEPIMPPVLRAGLEDHAVDIIDDYTYAVLDIGPKAAEPLVSVTFLLSALGEDGSMIFLGEDNDVDRNWESGVFADNFRGVWGSIDGRLVYMEVAYECEDYVIYSIPILLNGTRSNLSVSYDYYAEEYTILAAVPDTDGPIPSRGQRVLKPGDKITTLHLFSDADENGFSWREADTFTVTENTAFDELELPDGVYIFMFSMHDLHNEEYTSEAIGILIEDGWIYMGYE